MKGKCFRLDLGKHVIQVQLIFAAIPIQLNARSMQKIIVIRTMTPVPYGLRINVILTSLKADNQ